MPSPLAFMSLVRFYLFLPCTLLKLCAEIQFMHTEMTTTGVIGKEKTDAIGKGIQSVPEERAGK
jgi:hypothetical protein